MLAVFAIAVALNLAWEAAHFRLYTCPQRGPRAVMRCVAASLGDGVLVLALLGFGALLFRRLDWYRDPAAGGYVFLTAAGLVLGAAVELAALHVLRRWSYAVAMPLVPKLRVGLSPVLQMGLLSPLTVALADALS